MILQRETIESRQTNLLTQRELVNKVKRKSEFGLMKLQPILWLGMLPVTLLLFGKISLLSPFVNLIMVPLFSVLLIPLTLFALVLQLISLEMLSKNILVILSLVYEKIFYSLEWLSQHPLSQISLPPMQFWHWLLFITVAFFYFFNLKLKHILLGLWCVSLYFLSSLRHLDYEEFNVAVLDVGQGLSIVIEGPDYVLVYDTGASFQSGFNMADAVLMPYLHYRGIKKIDMLIVSHADNDHIGGFSVLNESFDIADILTSHVDDIPFANVCQTDMAWSVGYLHFKILSPELNSSFDRNNNSCVLLVSNGDLKVLLTGDIEKVAEDDLVSKQGDLTADIMLAPHHGSKTSSSKSFIEAVSPQLALVSAGYRNRYGHPHEDVVQRYLEQDVNLKSTINSGSMLLNIKKNRWNLTEYRINEKGFWNRQKNTDNYKK